MSKRKMFMRAVFTLVLIMTLSIAAANSLAAVYICPRADNDTKSIIQTTNILHNSTTLEVDIPILTTCHVESSGYSLKSFYPGTTGCTSEFVGHSIEVKSGGIGAISVAVSGATPITLTGNTNDRTYYFDTNRVDYTIHQSIWRLYYFNETHTGSHKLKLPSGAVYSTIVLGTYIQW